MERHQFRLICVAALFLTTLRAASAGDDASGRMPCSVDLSQPFTAYSITPKDKLWSESLVKKLGYKGQVVHFVRTSLSLKVGNSNVEGGVYQAVEKPDFFYVVNTDTMLKIASQWAYSPGVGGFSMHAPRSRNFIVSLNFVSGGVPFLSSSAVTRGIVTWNGDDGRSRLQ
jgi:hypothetical protein